MTGRTLLRLAVAALFGAAVTAPAVAQDEKQDKNRKTGTEKRTEKAEKSEKAKWTVKVFELKHRTPQELSQVLNMRPTVAAPTGQFVVQPGFPQPAYPVRVGVPGAPYTTELQPVQQRTSGYLGSSPQLLTSFDPEAKLLFVRGPEDQVRKAEELIKALDVPGDQLKKAQFGDLHLIPVSQDKLPQVSRTLANLRINTQTITIGDRAALAVWADGEDDDDLAEQVRLIVTRSDDTAKDDRENGKAADRKTDRNDK